MKLRDRNFYPITEKYSKMVKSANSKSSGTQIKLSPATLFKDYQEAEDMVDVSEKALEDAVARRSAAVQAIKRNLGDGPFSWRNRTVTVSQRSTKKRNEDGSIVMGPNGEPEIASVNYFFKTIGSAVQEIEE